MRVQWTLLLVVVALVVLSCSSSADEDVPPSETTSSSEPSSASDAAPALEQFCSDATAFVTDSRVRFINAPDAGVFIVIDEQLQALVGLAPVDVVDDVETLRAGFSAIGAAYATTGYEPSASFAVPTDVQQANGVASQNLERYLLVACDLEQVRGQQIDQIAEAFGIEDLDIAECLHTQMGDIANIDSSTLTPELMTTEVCGTSILGLLSGEAVTDS